MDKQRAERPSDSTATDEEIRTSLVRYWSDLGNQALVDELFHDDVVLEFPQSGERFVGLANVRAMRRAYPAQVALTLRRLRGGGAF
jgi:hypothetical protein